MKRLITSTVLLVACDVSPDKSIGNELVSPTSGSEATTNDGHSGNVPNGNDNAMGGTSELIDVELGAASAVLLADGLCPHPFDKSPGITLRFTNSTNVCMADLWNWIPESEVAFVEIYIPGDAPGVYEASEYEIENIHVTREPSGGGGAGGGHLSMGSVEITEIDSQFVTGLISGIEVFGSNWVNHDVNGPFVAVRCSAEEWLDVPEDPREHEPEEGFDPACTLPEPQ